MLVLKKEIDIFVNENKFSERRLPIYRKNKDITNGLNFEWVLPYSITHVKQSVRLLNRTHIPKLVFITGKALGFEAIEVVSHHR
jgi:hypothetical protein